MKEKIHYLLLIGYDYCHDGDEWIGIYSRKEELQISYQKTLDRLQETNDHRKVYIHAFEENSGKWKYDVKSSI